MQNNLNYKLHTYNIIVIQVTYTINKANNLIDLPI